MADEEKKPTENTEKDPENASESDEKVNDANAKKKDAAKAKEQKEEEDDDESSEEEEMFGLYDQPLVVEGKRQRKKTEFLVKDQMEIKKEPQPLVFDGKGETLGSMEVVNHEISKCTALELKPLHKLLFGRDGRTTEIKKNIKAFNGFNLEEGSKEYENKKFMVERFTNEGLKRLLEILDLEKKGTREDLKQRVFSFLMNPKGSGRSVKPTKKKTKKKSKSKSKGKGEKRKRTPAKGKNSTEEVKDDDEDDDDDDDNDENKEDKEDIEDEEPKKKKAKTESKGTQKPKGSPKKIASPTKSPKVAKKSDKKEKTKPEKKESAKKETKKDKKTPKKSKPVTVKITAGKRTPKKTPKKVEKPTDDDESSSDDEPLAKKIKKQPPSNEELAKVVKDLLQDADLDQVTVKSISKQVFSKFPEFDLSEKKPFIKETVYAVISGDAD